MGRHREFDVEKALDAAVMVFWRKGFTGTSYADLTEATGVARPGLYAAFGNKDELFLKVLDRYGAMYMRFVGDALELPTAREAVERYLRGSADAQSFNSDFPGCLSVNCIVDSSDEATAVRYETTKRGVATERAFRQKFKHAQLSGELPASASPAALARYVVMLVRGMAVQAKAGASRAQLHEMVDLAMTMWLSR